MVNVGTIQYMRVFGILYQNETFKTIFLCKIYERRTMKRAKITKYLLLTAVTVFIAKGIIENHSHYTQEDWFVVILVSAWLYSAVMAFYYFIEKRLRKAEARKNIKELPKVEIETNQEPLPTQYIETNSGIVRADGKPFTDEEVPFLMERSYEKALERERELAKVNPKFQRTDIEEDLSYQFYERYKHKISAWESMFNDLYTNSHFKDDLNQRIAMLHSALFAFEDAKKFFYSKGKGGEIYFQDTWEYMNNSQNLCFSFADKVKEEIKRLEYEKNVLIPLVLKTIENNDGILQKDIYSMLSDIPKEKIVHIFRMLEKNSAIIRTKKGNSYELHVIKKE